MNKFLKLILPLISMLCLTSFAYGQNELANRIPELQKKSKAVMCGIGGLTLITDNDEIQITSDLTDFYVFGPRVAAADLMQLLTLRLEANRTGKENPMSGDVGDLTGRIIFIVSRAQDSKAVPILAGLLEDNDFYVYRAAAYSLLEMAKINDDFRLEIEKITFPRKALSGLVIGELPRWLKIREVN